MMEKFLALLERFVVAHELIAANSAKTTLIEKVGDVVRAEETVAEQKAPAKHTGTTKPKAAPAKEPEPEEEEEEPAPKTRREQMAAATAASKAKAKAPDLDTLRDEIKTMATHIAEGDSDTCADEFDDLLEDFKVRTVTKLDDRDVEEFHMHAKELVGKYYEIED